MHRLVPGDVISGCIAFTGTYDWDLTRRVANAAERGGLLVDVGANMGYFSLLWAGRHGSNRAVAFEVAPRNVLLLRENIQANGLSQRVALREVAVGNYNGEVEFDVGPHEQTGWGGIVVGQERDTMRVPMVRLDDELAGTTIDLLKVDVEGADTWVLHGCEGLLAERSIRAIVYEQNERMAELGIDSSEAESFLRRFGYVARHLTGDNWLAVPE